MEAFIYPKKEDWSALLARPTASYEELESLVSQVFLADQAIVSNASCTTN